MGRELYIALQIRKRTTHRFIKNSCPCRSKKPLIFEFIYSLMDFYLLPVNCRIQVASVSSVGNVIKPRSLLLFEERKITFQISFYLLFFLDLHVCSLFETHARIRKLCHFHRKYDIVEIDSRIVIRRLESNWNTPSALSPDCFERKRTYFFANSLRSTRALIETRIKEQHARESFPL